MCIRDSRKIDELLGNEKPKKAENFKTLGYSEQEFEGEELVSVEEEEDFDEDEYTEEENADPYDELDHLEYPGDAE